MMKSWISSPAPWKQVCVKVLLVFALSTLGTDNSYGMAIAAEEENIENLIKDTSGLTPSEETLLTDTIKGIISSAKRSWYPETFSPFEDSSHSGASDMKRIVKLQTLADTGMKVIERVDERLKTIEEKERERLGRWGFLATMNNSLYQILTSNPDLLFEIKKYDCLKNKGADLPSDIVVPKDASGSIWMEYSDSVYAPFNCPEEPDFDRAQAARDHQKFMARRREQAARTDTLHHYRVRRASGAGNIVQVNMTLTNEEFRKTFYNSHSDDYKDLTRDLTELIAGILNDTEYIGVNDFSYRPGSVIATFHIETSASDPVNFVNSKLSAAISNNTLGRFSVQSSNIEVGVFDFANAHYFQWGVWGSCSKTCGTGTHSRYRTCNSTAPLACAHIGPSVETEECYEKFCSNECGGNLIGDQGNFSSPVVNGLYPKKAECIWQITVDTNHTIVVQFERFNLEKDKKCNFDYVAFYDGDTSVKDNLQYELMRFCGNTTPPHSFPDYGYPVNSSSNQMTIRFKSDATKERLGFSAIWHKVLRYDLRIPKNTPQYITALSFFYNPWSTLRDAAVPLGKATTCPGKDDDNCYFPLKQNIISRIISVFLSRDLGITASNPLVIKFEHILDETMFPEAYTGRKTCVTWDHKSSQAWTKRGCMTSFSNLTHTTCKCLHTGMFAVLSEKAPPPKDLNFKANIYVGCAVFLILAFATVHSLATKQKKTTGELFHLFEAIISGILMVIFLIGAHVPAEKELCGFIAFFLYYLVLSQFTWMLLTVFWMQNFMARFLSQRVKIKLVYFVLGWGFPLVLAGVAGKIDIDKNGHPDNVCWVSISGVGTVWGYGAPVFVMFIINVIILVYLLLPVVKHKYFHDKLRPRIIKEFFIMLSFVITWCVGVKVILDDRFCHQYFFCIFLILQGALSYNVCHESTELFWKEEEVNNETAIDKDEKTQEVEKDIAEEGEEKENENKKPRMTVKTLKNLNIYKENGVFVIEA
ncbi:uncharacterized protein LOC114524862 isoform X2 [Dendronephthya gigantea]|uniref:uncharacterized protein LOC114524862 isoform X2 n=1 Tax=Dendronephthya gigantea TaxID=151771 RepID=UPI00106AE97E|nr:uncharacterized protein LOC114524862 isoform X2 [Dendronephthya gigantea]